MAERVIRIEQRFLGGHPLGRHVNHDPRSLAPQFLVAETDEPVSRWWRRYTPILDQGSLGSCTGNAITGLLGTAPFYGSLYQARKGGLMLDENLAVELYERATSIDPFPGEYPPTDTGSDGLSACKAAQERSLIGQYNHITSLAAAHNAIKTGPFIIGSNWYEGFDNPDSHGFVSISGQVRGGHEYECVGYSAAYGRWKLVNSWGTGWSVGGYFHYSDETFAQLLSEWGDATVPVRTT